MSRSPKIGVVLSSGGGRGVFAHTGFLQALEQMGIKISAITGCSAGALVGGIYASGTDIEQWSNTLADVQTSAYWAPDSWPRFLWNMLVKKAVVIPVFQVVKRQLNLFDVIYRRKILRIVEFPITVWQ